MRPSDLIPKIAGWQSTGKLQAYKGDRLIEFIDGGAELYFAFQFKEAAVQEFTNGQENYLNVEVYEMDSSENSFGVYSYDTKGEHPHIGNDATYAGGLLKFWAGSFFVRIQANSESEPVKEVIFQTGGQIANRIGAKESRPAILAKLPSEKMIPDSVTYFHKNISLNNIYFISDSNLLNLSDQTEAVTAEYQTESGAPVRLILIKYPDQDAAKDALDRFLKGFLPDASAGSRVVQQLEDGKFCGTTSVNEYVILVVESADKDTAEQFLATTAARF